MKKYFVKVSATALALLTFSLVTVASAHEHDVFQIGDKQYQFTVGSLNEPIVVDDKTGVDLAISQVGMAMPAGMAAHDDGDHDEAMGGPVTTAEKTLKVEISAGSEKKTFDLVPAYGKPGSYYATFYPTLQTTYSYRFFGTLNNVPVDLTFSCNPAASSAQAEDKTKVELSSKVSRLSKAGAFSCPLAKADLGFPVPSVSNADLSAKVNSSGNSSDMASKSLAVSALVLSILGIITAGYALKKK